MKLSAREFRAWENKSVTLLGMSGVGKTRVAQILRQRGWFHYSADYRIGTRYLDESILDNVKRQAMRVPFLRDLLRSDSIYIANNITVDNLQPVSSFLGKIGDPQKGGLSLREFKRRQSLHRSAETAAMKDVPQFIRKAREIYGYRHFVNDSGGSLCELDAPEVVSLLAEHTVVLYIRATDPEEKALIQRAADNPKPLSYREEFLDEQLALYLQENSLPYVAMIDPDDFARWIFPELLRSRIPRYETIAAEHGYTVSSGEVERVTSEAEFLKLVERALERAK